MNAPRCTFAAAAAVRVLTRLPKLSLNKSAFIRFYDRGIKCLGAAGRICCVVSTFAFVPASAGQIALNQFSSAAVRQDFESLGAMSLEHAAPLVLGGMAYDADGSALTSGSKLGEAIGRSGIALGNNPERSDSSVGYVDVRLDNPALRAGITIGFEFPWEAEVQFLSSNSELVGSVFLEGIARDNKFAGWQAGATGISQLRVVNTFNRENRIVVDDMIFQVPEPSSNLQLILLLAALTLSRRSLHFQRCRNRR